MDFLAMQLVSCFKALLGQVFFTTENNKSFLSNSAFLFTV